MMKRNRGLLALIAVLVVLLVVYFGLQAWNKSKEEEEAAVVHVTDTAAEDIVSIRLDVGNGEMVFEKEEDTWVYLSDPDFPLAQSYTETMADTVGNITADRELSDGDTMEDYGLDEPTYTIEYTDADGNVTDVYFGNMTGENYYVTVGDEGRVYTVASTALDSLSYTLDDIAQLDTFPSIGSGNLVKEVITRGGETIRPCFSGSGAAGLPGDWSSPSRFIRLAFLRQYAEKGRNETEGVAFLFRLLQSASFPLGAVQLPESGAVTEYDRDVKPYDYTVYSSVLCAESLRFYWITYRNTQVRYVELGRLLEERRVLQFSLGEEPEFQDRTGWVRGEG